MLKALTNRVADDLGLNKTDRSVVRKETSDSKKRNTRFMYPTVAPVGPRTAGVKLEMSIRDENSAFPGVETRTVRSFISEYLSTDEFDDAAAFEVRTLAPVRNIVGETIRGGRDLRGLASRRAPETGRGSAPLLRYFPVAERSRTSALGWQK